MSNDFGRLWQALFCSPWRAERLAALRATQRTIELEDVAASPDMCLIAIDLGYNLELWLAPVSGINITRDAAIANGKLIVSQGAPLKSQKALRERGLRVERIATRT